MPGVLAVSVTDERIYALVEPDADPLATERAIVALFDAAGWSGRVTILGGRRAADRGPRFVLPVPRRWALIAAAVAAAMTMMVASLSGTVAPTKPPIADQWYVPDGAAKTERAAPATPSAGEQAPAGTAVRPSSGGSGGKGSPLVLPRFGGSVVKGSLPKPKPLPKPDLKPVLKPGLKPNPLPAVDHDPRPGPVPPAPTPKPKPDPAPAPIPPADPAPPPPKAPPPKSGDDDDRDDEPDTDGKKGKDGTKKIGHDEDDKKSNHVEKNGDKHGAREHKDRR